MSVKVFEARKVQRQFPNRLASGDFFNEFIYLGDQKGEVYKYPIRADQTQIIQKSVKDDGRKLGTRSRVDKVTAYVETGMIIVLSDEKLFVFDSTLNKPEMIKEKVHDFCPNQSFGAPCNLGIVVTTKKKEGFIFNWNTGMRKFEEQAKFLMSDQTKCLGYTRNHVILGLKNEYQILNTMENFAVKKIGLQVKGNPFFKVTNRDEILFFQDSIGIFMSPQANPRQRNPCVLQTPKPVLDVALSPNFCFVMFENVIEIFNTYDPKQFVPVQIIQIQGCRGLTNGRVFAFSKEEMVFLYEISFETQIKVLLEKCRVEEALSVLRQNVGENSQMINQIKLDAIWPLIKKLNLEKAKDIMKDIDFDVRQLITLFPEYLSLGNQQLMKPQKTMSLFISENLQEKQLRKEQVQKETLEYKKRAKLFLKEVLQYKREKFIIEANKQHLKEKIHYPTSRYSQSGVKFQDATLEEILQMVDYALIKWYLETGMYKQLEEFLSNNPKIFCTNLFSDFESDLKSSRLKDSPTLVPRLYAAFGRLDQALDGWQKVSETKDDNRMQIACEEAVKILAKLDDRDKVMGNLEWILKKKPKAGMEFFKLPQESMLPSDQVIRYFEADESENGRECLELYLEILVLEKKSEQERLHTKLIVKYLDNLFKVRPKNSKEEVNTPEFNDKLNKMRSFLRSEDAKYAYEVVLERIKGCQWLLQDEIYLYSREKKHDQALQKLIQKSMFPAAEKYCEQNQGKTLTKYFTKLINLYEVYVQKGNAAATTTKRYIMKFLREYVNHSELDAIQVMQQIPDDWMLNEQGGGGLYDFLESAISHTLHQKRSLNTAEYLSEMDLLNVEYNLAKAKQASVRFTYTKKCRVCHKPIAEKIFVVFPNGVVCDQACVKKEMMSICPVTGQDFEKTFKS